MLFGRPNSRIWMLFEEIWSMHGQSLQSSIITFSCIWVLLNKLLQYWQMLACFQLFCILGPFGGHRYSVKRMIGSLLYHRELLIHCFLYFNQNNGFLSSFTYYNFNDINVLDFFNSLYICIKLQCLIKTVFWMFETK